MGENFTIPSDKKSTGLLEEVIALNDGGERKSNYGNIYLNCLLTETICEILFSQIPKGSSYNDRGQKFLVRMAVAKLVRSVTGNPQYKDNYIDMINYLNFLAHRAINWVDEEPPHKQMGIPEDK